ALAYLNLGEIEKAEADFEVAQALESQSGSVSDAPPCAIGVTLWLRGRHRDGAMVWEKTLGRLETGEIEFSDLAGGVGVAALLWFGAVHLEDHVLLARAQSFLEAKFKKRTDWPWPGPIGLFCMGSLAEVSLRATAHSGPNVLAARRGCQA